MIEKTYQEIIIKSFFNEYEVVEQNQRTRNLWMSVIEQAIIDLSTPPRNKKMRINYKKAYMWFFGSDGDFEEVCSLINLDHKKILKSLEIIKNYGCDR